LTRELQQFYLLGESMTEDKKNKSKKTYKFKSEVSELMQLMIHSLYSNKEIFLRELVSNASDACEKLRFESIKNPDLLGEELKIQIDFDDKNKTISITDNGIGMDEEDAKKHLGTIAKSGSADFIKQLKDKDDKSKQGVIGQFGVGFYSVFMVCDKVEVFTRRVGSDSKSGICWSSTGSGSFGIKEVSDLATGTTVKIYLNEENKEFASFYKLEGLIKKYSDHLGLPVQMKKPIVETDDKKDAKKEEPKFETINNAKALWLEPKRKVTEEQYKEFYKHITNDFSDPILWSHNKVEGNLEYSSIMYIPGSQPFDLWQRESSTRGLKLFVQRVFIMDKTEAFLPMYLRFVRGVVDSNDLDLNVSREILQDNPVVDKIKSALTKRMLDLLFKTSEEDKEAYKKFWDMFGLVLKEGVAEEFKNKELLLSLIRFASTKVDKEENSFKEYVRNMKADQKHIYYLLADSMDMAKSSPHLELLNKKGIEVILFTSKIDDWFVGMIGDVEGKSLKNIAKGDLDLDDSEEEKNPEKEKEIEKNNAPVIEKLNKVLKDKVADIKVSNRLTDSACCLVLGENDLSPQMRQMLEASGQTVPDNKPVLEVNIEHKLIKMLLKEKNEGKSEEIAKVVYDQAKLMQDGSLEDPASFVKRVNDLLLK
jgi:molecular chaperone HtpG